VRLFIGASGVPMTDDNIAVTDLDPDVAAPMPRSARRASERSDCNSACGAWRWWSRAE